MKKVWLLLLFTLATSWAPSWAQEQEDGGGSKTPDLSSICIVKVSNLPLLRFTDIGTGTWISDDMVLSCWHNVRDEINKPGFTLWLESIDGVRYDDVTVLVKDVEHDLVVFKVGGDTSVHGIACVTSDVTPPTHVSTVGYDPSVGTVVVNSGPVIPGRYLGSTKGGGKWLYCHQSKVVQGMSGGPTINSQGEICGVNQSSSIKISKDGTNNSVCPTWIHKLLDKVDM